MTGGPDLLVTGRIATLAGETGFGWVDAIAIVGGRVVAAGNERDVEAAAGKRARQLQLAPDEVAIPGLIDAHLHLAEGGLSAERVDLTAAWTLDEGLTAVRRAHQQLGDGRWLQGHGWLADRWGGWPTAGDLERATPGRPAALWAHDHHALWANETALALALIDHDTPDPPGGALRRGPGGEPTGVLHETAARLVTSRIPVPTPDEIASAVESLGQELLALGVTGVHDPGSLSLETGLGSAIEAYRRLAAAGRLPVRIHACIREEQLDAAIAAGLRSGRPVPDADDGEWLRFGWLKLFADGTLGSRTAAMLDPFEPEADGSPQPGDGLGLWMTEPGRLRSLASRAAASGIACQIHAIGDRAVRAALDALEPTIDAARPVRPRVEHVQLAAASDVPRFGSAGIVASVQPVHLRSDAEAARRLWGKRAERDGYRLRSLLDAGSVVAFGTDAPVESIDPWPGLELAITRRSPAWPAATTAFGPQESLDLAMALRAATIAPATSTGLPDRGRLTPGSVADLSIIDAAALAEPVEHGGALGRCRPRRVMVGGQLVFEG